jgi:hypothetical protein
MRMRYAGHVWGKRGVHEIFQWESQNERLHTGRSRQKRKNNVKWDYIEIGWGGG